jgi:hypothetical protein
MALQSSSSASDPVPHHKLERPVNNSAPRMSAALRPFNLGVRPQGDVMDASLFRVPQGG